MVIDGRRCRMPEVHAARARRCPLAVVALAMLVVAGGAGGASACRGKQKPSEGTTTRRPGWPSGLTLGLAGGIDAESALESNKPLAARLEKATGLPVKLYHATAYSSVVQAMRSKRVDGLQIGVFSYLLAVREANAEALAVYVNTFAEPAVFDPRLRPEYCSVIVVKKGNGIRSLADVKGRTFTFVEPASTSGHLVPKTELMKAGLVADRDFKTRFAGSHASSMLALWNGQSDASAVSEMSLRNAVASHQIDYCGFPDHDIGRVRSAEEVKAVFDACPDGSLAPLHYSYPIPGTPIAFRADLPADLKAIIKASLLSTRDDPDFITHAKRWYVDPSQDLGLPVLDAYYSRLREMTKLLDLDLKGLQ
jgi:phosphonate transport system substrate-binding protein